jgi:hypothetical protein
VTDETLKAIGLVSFEFVKLEWLLDKLYVGLNTDFKGDDNTPTDFDSISKRLNLIAFRIEKKHSDHVKEWHNLEWEVRNLAKAWDGALRSISSVALSELVELSNNVAAATQKISLFLDALKPA